MSKKNTRYKKVLCLLLIIFSVYLTACNQKKSFHIEDVTQYLQTEGHIENEGMDITKQTHKYRDQTSGYQRGEVSGER